MKIALEIGKIRDSRPVILSEAKNLNGGRQRFFASLRMADSYQFLMAKFIIGSGGDNANEKITLGMGLADTSAVAAINRALQQQSCCRGLL